jgi:hypothetical protein
MVAKTPEYLVSHGKTAALGRFLATALDAYCRGERVVVQGERGVTVGVVLCETTERQARVLGPGGIGLLLRRFGPDDEAARPALLRREQELFDAARQLAAALDLPTEILDCELSLDGRRVILQYLASAGCDPAPLADRLSAGHGVEVWLENLAAPVAEEHAGGCGEPGCGRANGGGGCDTCGSGGCSSCGSGKVDMRDYFAHLREKMDKDRRTPLL